MAEQKIGELIVQLKADTQDYLKKLEQMEQQTTQSTSKVSSAFEKVGSVMTRLGVGLTAFAATAMKSAMDWGNAVDDLADKTGLAGEEASKLLVLAKRVGVGTDEANQMFSRFARSVYNATDAMKSASAEGKTSNDILTRLGVSALDANGNWRNTMDIFMDVKNAISGMGDGVQKTAFEMELFGKSGTAMHDMLNMTDEEMQKVIAKAEAMGLIISSDTAAAWERFERNLNSSKGIMTSVGIQIGNEMLPKLEMMLQSVQNLTSAYVGLNKENKEVVNGMISLVSYSGSAVLAIRAIATAVGLAVNPWVLLAAAIIGATGALVNYFDTKDRVQSYNSKAEVYEENGKLYKKQWADDANETYDEMGNVVKYGG